MTVFRLPATCLQCAGPLALVNASANDTFGVAILECEPCRRQWELSMRLSVHRTPEQMRDAEKTARRRARQRVMV